MNKKQRIVLFTMSAFIVLMFLFPPYVIRVKESMVVKSGYGFIFDLSDSDYSVAPTVNISLLLAQIFGVLVVGGIIWFALKEQKVEKASNNEESKRGN